VPTQNDESHSIEPSANVGENPQKDAKFNRIDEILDEEQAAQLGEGAVDVADSDAGNLLHLLLSQGDFSLQQGPANLKEKWVRILIL